MSLCKSFVRSLARPGVLRAAIPAAGLLFAFAGAASAVPPTVYNLGVMPGGTYSSNGIVSADGNTVTGYGDTTVPSGSPVRPFRWVLPGPMQVVPQTVSSEGRGISYNGQHIVGFNSSNNTPFRWTLSGGFTPLSLLPGGTTAFANGTNSNSAATIGYGNSTTSDRAIRWNSLGTPQDLGIIPGATSISTGGPGSWAYGISADGSTVVGTADWAPGFQHAFRWNMPFGPMVSLGTLPGGYTCRAVAISTNNSTIVGYSDTTGSSGNPRAWRLKAPMPMQNLGVIPGSGGSPLIYAAAVSGSGARVVGRSYDIIFGNRAWIWMGSTGMLDLKAHVASLGGNVTGWQFLEAHGISTDGTAVSGWGTFNGAARAFLIKGLPCLDPTAVWWPDTSPTATTICADPNWPVGTGPSLPEAAATFTMDTDGDDPLEHAWFVTIGDQGGTAPMPITGPLFEDAQSGVAFSVEGWNTPTITISNFRPAPVQPNIWVIGTVNNPCGGVATTARQLIVAGVCVPGQPGPCQPADVADDAGQPLPTTASNTGVNEGDYNGFFQGFFDATAYCDIADDAGNPRPPFNNGQPNGSNTGVNEGDYNCFFQFFFNGCP